MKKLLSLAAIVGVVTCTFAFTSKKQGTFCVRNAANNGCELKTLQVQDDIHGIVFKYWPNYVNETTTPCANATTAQCATTIKLSHD